MSARPRGGVVAVKFAPASAGVAAASNGGGSGSGSGASAADFSTFFSTAPEYVFREDGATYAESLTEDGLVRHVLEVEFPATAEARPAVDQLLARSVEGLVAQVVTASGETLIVGWSERFGAGYPLRVSEFSSLSGAAPGDLPTLRVVFQAVDSSPATS